MTAILDAAEQLLAERGEDAWTVSELAVRADTAIGSVYQFFAGKEEILDALVKRLAERLRQTPARLLDPASVGSLPLMELAARLVDQLAEMAFASPAFVSLVERAKAGDASIEAGIVRNLAALFRHRSRGLTLREAERTARLTMQIIRGGVRLALGMQTPRDRRWMVEETSRAVAAYLAARLGG